MNANQTVAAHAAAKYLKAVSDRDSLPTGSSVVDLKISGKVDGRKIEAIPVRGQIIVDHDGQRTKPSPAPAAEIVAAVLARVPKTRRQELIDGLVKGFEKTESVDTEPELLTAARELISRMRITTVVPVRGAITFTKSKAAA